MWGQDTKRLASVAPEVDLRERTLCLPQNANKAAHSGFETQTRHQQKSKTGAPVAPKMDMCPPKTLKKKKNKKKINKKPKTYMPIYVSGEPYLH